jgi:hypothetical protein
VFAAAALSFLLVIQNFAWDVLPDRRVEIAPADIRPFSAATTYAFSYAYAGSEPDRWPSQRSRLCFFEDGKPYTLRVDSDEEVRKVGGDRFAHTDAGIVFASTDNSDPRTNGRKYSFTEPRLYHAWIGVIAAWVLLASIGILWRMRGEGSLPAAEPAKGRWPLHFAGFTAVFLLGLYLNTGTLAPYAITSSPYVSRATGYAFNQDIPHFRALFFFVDGRDRSTWDHAILLRRILFPVLGWPFMKAFGFETGGTIASIAFNLAGFVAALSVLRRRVGERGAVLAGWLLALYPGAAYWAGQPFTYSLIVPSSLLLLLGLWRLTELPLGGQFALLSAAMGVGYLGYDLAAFFVPATLLALVWNRRPVDAILSSAIQVAPLALWVVCLSRVFHQPASNPNSDIYRSILLHYRSAHDLHYWLGAFWRAQAVGFDVFFASNFIFIPALFLGIVALNTVTSRVRFTVAEGALLLSALAFFLVVNLSPQANNGSWMMNGTWISRLYQPVLPALIFFAARWWQALPRIPASLWAAVAALLALVSAANALVVFGPILDNPLRVSETAYYRFYDHTRAHFIYELNLAHLGRRPLGFPKEQPDAPSSDDLLTAAQGRLASIRAAIAANAGVLKVNMRACRAEGRALAEAKLARYSGEWAERLRRGEVTAEEARLGSKTVQDFMSPEVRALDTDATVDLDAPPPPRPEPKGLSATNDAIGKENEELAALEGRVLAVQALQRDLEAELARLQAEQKAKR